jgi:leader peptidase (prepilin peptidase)/N-methyltransferase
MDLFTTIAAGLIGVVLGWVVNWLADTLPDNRQLSTPVCHACQQPTPWRIFLLYLPCPQCGKPRQPRAFLVMAAMLSLAIWMALVPPTRLGLWVGLLLLAYFMLVTVIDMEHRLVLHVVSLVGAIGGVVLGTALRGQTDFFQGLLNSILGGAAGFLMMLVLYYLGELFNRWMSRLRGQQIDEVAMGFGDVTLSGVLGLMVGWPDVAGMLLVGIILGGLISGLYLAVSLLARRYQMFTAIPYAPFLILAAMMFLYIARN